MLPNVPVAVYFITNKVKDAESDLMKYAEKIFDMTGDQTKAGDKPTVGHTDVIRRNLCNDACMFVTN